jgi:GTP-binding protein
MDMTPLFQATERIPPPPARDDELTQFQVSLIDHSDSVARIGVGRIHAGTLDGARDGDRQARRPGHQVAHPGAFTFETMERVRADRIGCGDVAGRRRLADLDLEISDTICDPENPRAARHRGRRPDDDDGSSYVNTRRSSAGKASSSRRATCASGSSGSCAATSR